MKHFYLLLLLFAAGIGYAQSPTIPINVDGLDDVLKENVNTDITVDKPEIKQIILTYTLPDKYTLIINSPEGAKPYTNALSGKPIVFTNDIAGKNITLELKKDDKTEKKWSFFIKKVTPAANAGTGTAANTQKPPAGTKTFDQLIEEMKLLNNEQFDAKGGRLTPFGYVDKEGRIHIYIDYRGNNLLTTIPQGIADAQYVVHVLSPKSEDETLPTYTIKQRTGSFNDALNFRNSDAAKFTTQNDGTDGIRDQPFLLSTSTENISFDLVSVKKGADDEFIRKPVESYTIKMTPTYQGSFDIGLVKSELANPTYSLVTSPDGLSQTVKVTDNGESEGVATLMATFYYSPVVILESIFGKKPVPFYKLNGRNFLDDHKIYERFYPTVGVGLSDKVFENLFIGINWEVVRGFALFYGWNYRKVNTFNMPGFEEGVTTVTEDQFNYYTNEKWKTKPAYGIKLDLLVVMGLFGKK
jgi:hypothetical protein